MQRLNETPTSSYGKHECSVMRLRQLNTPIGVIERRNLGVIATDSVQTVRGGKLAAITLGTLHAEIGEHVVAGCRRERETHCQPVRQVGVREHVPRSANDHAKQHAERVVRQKCAKPRKRSSQS
jgi:hypothetical protein